MPAVGATARPVTCVIKPHQNGTSEGCRSSLRCSHSAYIQAHSLKRTPAKRVASPPGARSKREKSYRSWQLTLGSPARLWPGRPTSASSAKWGSSAPCGRRRAPSSVPAGCLARSTPRRPLARRRSSPGSSAASLVVILALIHGKFGAMYPVSGGTARFPHFGFGALTGMSFGFFSWLQAVTVAPIECFAVMNYGSH